MNNARKQTIQESGQAIYPYTSLPTKNLKDCDSHEYEKRQDGMGHEFYQCRKCYCMK